MNTTPQEWAALGRRIARDERRARIRSVLRTAFAWASVTALLSFAAYALSRGGVWSWQ